MPTQAVISESKTKMSKAVDVLQDDFRAFRGGRATPGLVDHLKVDYYGSPTPLKSLATTPIKKSSLDRPWISRRRLRAAI